MRAEYSKLALDLPGLAADFGYPLTLTEALDAYVLALAMDHMDEAIDSQAEGRARRQTGQLIVDYLKTGDEPALDQREADFQVVLRAIRQVAVRRHVVGKFAGVVEALIEVGELLRLEASPSGYISRALEEAGHTIALLFTLLPELPPALQDFLTRTGEIGNVGDKLVDLAEDRQEGRTLVNPSPGLVVNTVLKLWPSAWRTFCLHPNPLILLLYAGSYLRFGFCYQSGRQPRMVRAVEEWTNRMGSWLPPEVRTASRV